MEKVVDILSEFNEAEDEDSSSQKVDPEAQKRRIRQIIAHQKYMLLSDSLSSSSSFSSSESGRTSSSSSGRSSSSSLLELMKAGGVSLGKLFDMEHNEAFATHLYKDFSISPVTKPRFLWGSDSDNGFFDTASWSPVKPFRMCNEGFGSHSPVKFPLEFYSFTDDGLGSTPKVELRSRWKLTRKPSTKALPGFGMWRCKGFRFRLRLRIRLRLRKLKSIICG